MPPKGRRCGAHGRSPFHKETNRRAACQDQENTRLTREPKKTNRDINRLNEAIETDVPGEAIREPVEEVPLEQIGVDGNRRRRSHQRP